MKNGRMFMNSELESSNHAQLCSTIPESAWKN